MGHAVRRYRNLIIERINPFVRRMEFDGFTCDQTAERLVEDYRTRNFTTAGGWALEKLAEKISPHAQKSNAKGIDLEWVDATTGDRNLYVIKSGLVTRNSDILDALKTNIRKAERLIGQGGDGTRVNGYYGIVSCKPEDARGRVDGVFRPSSAQVWAHMTGLPPTSAVDLVLAIAIEAGPLVRRDVSSHIAAMKLLVGDYLATRDDLSVVDWSFIAKRNMTPASMWADEDKIRHLRALGLLDRTGYRLMAPEVRAKKEPEQGKKKPKRSKMRKA